MKARSPVSAELHQYIVGIDIGRAFRIKRGNGRGSVVGLPRAHHCNAGHYTLFQLLKTEGYSSSRHVGQLRIRFPNKTLCTVKTVTETGPYPPSRILFWSA
jgi:hypothetical protein